MCAPIINKAMQWLLLLGGERHQRNSAADVHQYYTSKSMQSIAGVVLSRLNQNDGCAVC